MQLEASVIDEVAKELQEKGYDVVVQPHGNAVPDFLSSFSPDLIAFGREDNVVVEFSRRGEASASKLAGLAEAVRGRPGWHLRVVRYSSEISRAINTVDKSAIRRTVQTLRGRLEELSVEGAFLLAWGAFEATARNLDFARFQKPQSPGRVVNELASMGYLSSAEQAFLRGLVDDRNRLIHGQIDVRVKVKDVREFLDIIERLLLDPMH